MAFALFYYHRCIPCDVDETVSDIYFYENPFVSEVDGVSCDVDTNDALFAYVDSHLHFR